MSITVVPTTAKAPSAAATDNVSGKGTLQENAATPAGQDFASLLFGQLNPALQESIPERMLPAAADDSATQIENPDGTAVVAALGLMVNSERLATAPGGSVLAKVDGQAPTPLQSAPAADYLKLDAADQKITVDLPGPGSGKPIVDDKSAIIAASLSSKAPTDLAARPTAGESAVPRSVATEAVVASLPVSTPGAAPLAVTTPVREHGWATDFADKVVWLASNDRQSAKLTLNPAHLGPLEISLNIDKGHATAAFVSANAEVRDALESALPRLREMFASAGIALGQTSVSAESFSQQAGDGAENPGAARWSGDNAILVGSPAQSMSAQAFTAQWSSGMVDTFA